MGLDFSHGHARWSYSGFNRARSRLAACFGITLDHMQGFGGKLPWPSVEQLPLLDLLYHSDCDGELFGAQCRKLAPLLRTAVDAWPKDDYDRKNFLALADAMDEAAAEGESLRFI